MQRAKLTRAYSDSFVAGMGDFENKNVEWMQGKFIKICYVLFVLTVWFILHVSNFFSPEDCWTVTNIVHLVITFVMLHWVKGCPDDTTQGEYNGLTLYEQIDGGTPWTSTKKFLMLVPTLLTLAGCYFADYKSFYIVINSGIFLISIIPKIPEMHRYRIFGINSTPGIDTEIDYVPKKAKTTKKK